MLNIFLVTGESGHQLYSMDIVTYNPMSWGWAFPYSANFAFCAEINHWSCSSSFQDYVKWQGFISQNTVLASPPVFPQNLGVPIFGLCWKVLH